MIKLIGLMIVAAVLAEPEADPQYVYANPYYGVPLGPQPVVSPDPYVAHPGWLVGQSFGTYLPGVFGWNRGHDYFPIKRHHYLHHLPGHRHGGHHNHANYGRGSSGADGNKFDKIKKRSADAEPEADPQYFINPYIAHVPHVHVAAPVPVPFAPVHVHHVHPEHVQVPSSQVEADETKSYTPTVYAADPIYNPWTENNIGVFLPHIFGWERGHKHFKFKKHHKLHHLPGHRHGGHHNHQNYGRGSSGADSNKFDKIKKKRSADAEPEADPQYIVSPYVPYAHHPYPYVPIPEQVAVSQNSYAPLTYIHHPYQYAPTSEPVEKSYTPTTYAANPGWMVNQGIGTLLPGAFGWHRGHERFHIKKKHKLHHLPGHRHGGHHNHQNYGRGSSGADSNKFDKI